MTFVVVLLIVAVAMGRGGYDPWAMLVLEVGSAGLLLWTVVEILWGTSPQERSAYLARRRARKNLPYLARHPATGAFLRSVSLGRISAPGGSDVEIIPPGSATEAEAPQLLENRFVLFGFPFQRTGIGIPLMLLTLWVGLSIVPVGGDTLELLSPRAQALRLEAESLVSPDGPPERAPWSLAPFLTLRSIWMWLAYLALFYVSVQLGDDPRKVERLTGLLVIVGVAYGIYGIGQWLLGLRELFGTDPSAAGLRATGSFGNRNHYAAFMAMLLLCSLGWLGSRWAKLTEGKGAAGERRRKGVVTQEAKAKLFIAGLGIVVLSLGLIFSLSRSGISFALVGCAVFALLLSPAPEPFADETIELGRSGKTRVPRRRKGRRSTRVYWALALAVLSVAFWIGIDPVVSRFELIPEEWEAEKGRWQVWVDSLGAVEDYWLTGSGLSSFRYLFPIYRSFGGRIFYSWAHNDYLQALIELGAPGLLLVLWIMAGVWLGAGRVRQELLDDPPLLHLHAGYCAAAVAIALHSFTDFSLHMAADFALLSVIAGVVVGLGKRRTETRRSDSPEAVSQ